jgi:hypothetical protein
MFFQIILAGLVGGAFAYAWQRRGWLFQQNLKIATDKHEAQLALIRDFFTLVDKRIYASRIYLDETISRDIDRINRERDTYKAVVSEWNERVPGILVLIRGRFSYQTALDLENYFLPAFTVVDSKLRKKRLLLPPDPTSQQELSDMIRSDLYKINFHARDQMQTLFEKTRHTMRLLEPEPEIKLSNSDALTIPYLIKGLFKPRSYS